MVDPKRVHHDKEAGPSRPDVVRQGVSTLAFMSLVLCCLCFIISFMILKEHFIGVVLMVLGLVAFAVSVFLWAVVFFNRRRDKRDASH